MKFCSNLTQSHSILISPGTRSIKGIGKDNLPIFALGIGDIRVRTRVDGVWHDGIIQDALFAPNLGGSLFSLSAATERGIKAIFEDSHVTLIKNIKIIATASRVSQKLYLMDMKSIAPGDTHEDRALVAKQASLQVWHERLGHVSHNTIKKMCKAEMADGLLIDKNVIFPELCEGCIMGKQHRLAFQTDRRNRARKIGGLIHTDVCGPMNIASLAGSYYFVTFRDDFTGYGVVNFMK